ncbi:MAG: L-seryl-tRNA(Sec) selenium transferase [Candidatus Marinimicrobia bacterium]|nr:L-seryl-tRNA(Sec) selenium transferase [Candidatus Neomarinimicrobiota bacterium]
MTQNIYKNLPSVSEVLAAIPKEIQLHQRVLTTIIDGEIASFRQDIKFEKMTQSRQDIIRSIVNKIRRLSSPSMISLINGTGVVLHTGFGRAPQSGKVLRRVAKRLEGFVNLEFDLETGKRGERQHHLELLLRALTGAELGIMVNNNAAAVLLSLNTIAEGKEVVVSRGQQVEIGGSFRIPDIIAKSGCKMVEVGTTNRTHLADYESAITENTGLLLWVHTSNYIVEGFTKEVSLKELVDLGKRKNIPVMADLGSGALIDLHAQGLPADVPVHDVVDANVDIVTFSGDKLLGGPQAGLTIGKSSYLKRIFANPLYRAVRCDKMCVALMEETLRMVQSDGMEKDNLTHELLTVKVSTLRRRGERIIASLTKKRISALNIQIIDSHVEAGSGSLPVETLPSIALKFQPKTQKVTDLSRAFRKGNPPVVGYISERAFYVDLKAVLPKQISQFITRIKAITL